VDTIIFRILTNAGQGQFNVFADNSRGCRPINYDFFDVGCFTSNNPFDFDGDPDYDLDPEII